MRADSFANQLIRGLARDSAPWTGPAGVPAGGYLGHLVDRLSSGGSLLQRIRALTGGRRPRSHQSDAGDHARGPERRRLAEQVRPGWFAVRLPASAALLAADDDDVALRAETLDGSMLVVVRRREQAPDAYDLELMLGREVDLPAIVVVQYSDRLSQPMRLLVPVTNARIGRATSTVGLADLDPAVSIEYGLTSLDEAADDETVARSIAAAASTSTIRAWSEVAVAAGPELREMIHRLLDNR